MEFTHDVNNRPLDRQMICMGYWMFFLSLSVEFVNPTSIAPSTSHGLMELHFSGIPKFYTRFLNVQNSSSYYHNDFETKIISHFLHFFVIIKARRERTI